MTRRTFEAAVEITDDAVEVLGDILVGNEIAPLDVSGSVTLSNGLNGVAQMLDRAATEVVDEKYPGLQPIERLAAVKVEAFRQTKGFDLMAMCLRVKILREIQESRLLAVHPAQYGSLEDMALDNGMSISELAFELDLVNVILPFVQNDLDVPAYEFYQSIGRSKIKEMMAPLKSLISGDQANTPHARETVERLIQEAYDGMREEVAEQIDRELQQVSPERQAEAGQETRQRVMATVRRRAARDLIDVAERLPVRELRRRLRPDPTANIQFIQIPDGENVTLVATITPDQLQMIRARFGTRLDLTPVELANDPATRQAEAFRMPPLRRLYESLFGGGR